jgi:hypothetical protein
VCKRKFAQHVHAGVAATGRDHATGTNRAPSVEISGTTAADLPDSECANLESARLGIPMPSAVHP